MRPVVPLAVSFLLVASLVQSAPGAGAAFASTDWAASATPGALALSPASPSRSVTITATQVDASDDAMGGRIFLAVPAALASIAGGPCLTGTVPGYNVAICTVGVVGSGTPQSMVIPVTYAGGGEIFAGFGKLSYESPPEPTMNSRTPGSSGSKTSTDHEPAGA